MPLINVINQSTIATHTLRVFIQSKENIESKILKKQKLISFTQDAWMAPDSTAFMGMTAHYINSDFTIHNLTVAVPHIQGTHTGEKFAEIFHDILKKYDIVDQLHPIMAENALVNTKMATELHLRVPSFNTKLNLLGCLAHVINLAAKIGISMLGPINEPHDGEPPSTHDMDRDGIQNPMDISFVTSPANGADINSKPRPIELGTLFTPMP
ncbi:uncharacterized protein VP01_3561g5 [Puccinia sorghi]|uniref:DUF659 domain-containing protein n=1 Tax=Puccinia sorghi TaxID=27349 RepID=A0A0L6UVC2_9BASI|nr:uncharacterized protein VP01_3561g5 [Puccinia sorghi]